MLRGIISVYLLFFLFLVLPGQDNSYGNQHDGLAPQHQDFTNYICSVEEGSGIIHYFRDTRIDKILSIQIDKNKRDKGIPGYRVQLYRSNTQKLSKERAFEIEAMVYKKFGTATDVEVIFESPIWRVRVGNFRLVNEAMKEEARYKSAFPDIADDISVVHTTIDFPDFKKREVQEYSEGR